MGRSRTVQTGATTSGRLAALEREIRELEARLARLTEAAARNEALLHKTQSRELELLAASSLGELLDELIHGLKDAYQLDAVSLVLHDPQHDIRHLLSGEDIASDVLEQIRFVAAVSAELLLERPWLGPYRAAEHAQLFAHAPPLGSLALIPLHRGHPPGGALIFGSADPARFTRELASDFLAHLGVIAGVCIENAVNRARLVRSGLTDFLTGLHNRRYLEARLTEELARAQRACQPVACLMIDVDHFKRFNDRYGHLAGDAVLREVARRIGAETRLSDAGARFGGDEFAIFMPNATVRDGATLARRVLEAVRGSAIRVAEGSSETATLSIGVAAAAPGRDTRDFSSLALRLMAEADAALYRAKRAGRDTMDVSEESVA